MIAAPQAAVYAGAAEAIYAPGVFTPALPPSLAGWAVKGYVAGSDALLGLQQIGLGQKCYYGFMAQRGNDYIEVYRGTENAIEWLEDGEAQLYNMGNGSVELGFWTIFKSFQAIPDPPKGLNVTVMGHSLGAPLAQYRTLKLAENGIQAQGYYFASPKPGDKTFASYFDSQVKNYTVYNYTRDLVPRLPLSLPYGFDFSSLNNFQWLKPSASVPTPNIITAHNVLNYARLLGWNGVSTY